MSHRKIWAALRKSIIQSTNRYCNTNPFYTKYRLHLFFGRSTFSSDDDDFKEATDVSVVAVSKFGTTPSSSMMSIFDLVSWPDFFVSSFTGVLWGTSWHENQGDNPGWGVAICGTYLWRFPIPNLDTLEIGVWGTNWSSLPPAVADPGVLHKTERNRLGVAGIWPGEFGGAWFKLFSSMIVFQ